MNFKLSIEAANDLENIWVYTLENWITSVKPQIQDSKLGKSEKSIDAQKLNRTSSFTKSIII